MHNDKKWLLEIRAVRYTHVIINIICENSHSCCVRERERSQRKTSATEVDGELSKTIKCNAHIGARLEWPQITQSACTEYIICAHWIYGLISVENGFVDFFSSRCESRGIIPIFN